MRGYFQEVKVFFLKIAQLNSFQRLYDHVSCLWNKLTMTAMKPVNVLLSITKRIGQENTLFLTNKLDLSENKRPSLTNILRPNTNKMKYSTNALFQTKKLKILSENSGVSRFSGWRNQSSSQRNDPEASKQSVTTSGVVSVIQRRTHVRVVRCWGEKPGNRGGNLVFVRLRQKLTKPTVKNCRQKRNCVMNLNEQRAGRILLALIVKKPTLSPHATRRSPKIKQVYKCASPDQSIDSSVPTDELVVAMSNSLRKLSFAYYPKHVTTVLLWENLVQSPLEYCCSFVSFTVVSCDFVNSSNYCCCSMLKPCTNLNDILGVRRLAEADTHDWAGSGDEDRLASRAGTAAGGSFRVCCCCSGPWGHCRQCHYPSRCFAIPYFRHNHLSLPLLLSAKKQQLVLDAVSQVYAKK